MTVRKERLACGKTHREVAKECRLKVLIDDYIYYYDGLELTVNEIDGVLRITGIVLADDTVETPQGLTIGMEIGEALARMDELEDEELQAEEENSIYSFRHGPALLLLKADKSGEITAIQYIAAGEDD